MKKTIYIAAIIFLCGNAYGYMDDYPPHRFDETFDRSAQIESVAQNEPGRNEAIFGDTKIHIRQIEEGWTRNIVEIFEDGKIVARVTDEDGMPYLSQIFSDDLDANGLRDFILERAGVGTGLNAALSEVIILLQDNPGSYRQINLFSYGFDMRDFVNLNKDEAYEMLVLDFDGGEGIDGKLHNYWIYGTYRFENYDLVYDPGLDSRYPKFIWYTHKPNDQETSKLSDQQKQKMFDPINRIESKSIQL